MPCRTPRTLSDTNDWLAEPFAAPSSGTSVAKPKPSHRLATTQADEDHPWVGAARRKEDAKDADHSSRSTGPSATAVLRLGWGSDSVGMKHTPCRRRNVRSRGRVWRIAAQRSGHCDKYASANSRMRDAPRRCVDCSGRCPLGRAARKKPQPNVNGRLAARPLSLAPLWSRGGKIPALLQVSAELEAVERHDRAHADPAARASVPCRWL